MIFIFLFSFQLQAATSTAFFSDLESFRDKSLSLKSEQQNLEAASDSYLSSQLFWTPKISLSAVQTKTGTKNQPAVDQDYLQADATLNLFRAGGDWNTLQSRKASKKAQQLQLDNETLRVELRAADLIFKSIYLNEAKKIQQDLLRIKEESLRIANERFRQGQLPLQEVKKSEVDLTQQKNNTRQAQLEALQNESEVKGLFITAFGTKDWPFEESQNPKWQGLPSLPVVEQKSLIAESLEESWRSTRAGHWPTLDLSLQYQKFPIKTQDNSQWVSTLSLTLPLWSRYEVSAQTSSAFAQYTTALNDLKTTEQQSKAKLEFLKQKIDLVRLNLKEAKSNLEKSKDLYQSILKSFRMGRLSTNDLILEQNRLLDTQTALISSQLVFHQTLIETCTLIGLRSKECL